MYLFGCKFKLNTDNKGVEMILNNPKSNPGARMKRWVLRLSQYNFSVEHVPGKDNISDYLSRLCQDSSPHTFIGGKATESFVNLAVRMAKANSFSLDEIINSTQSDDDLVQVKNALLRGHFLNNESAYKRFGKVLNECCVSSEGLVVRGLRIVLPQALRRRAVKLAHEDHQGISKTKSLLRSKVWFPDIDSLVEEEISLCRECQLNGERVRPEPLQMTKMPERPWEYLRADFKGPLPDGQMALIVQDEHSRFPSIQVV